MLSSSTATAVPLPRWGRLTHGDALLHQCREALVLVSLLQREKVSIASASVVMLLLAIAASDG